MTIAELGRAEKASAAMDGFQAVPHGPRTAVPATARRYEGPAALTQQPGGVIAELADDPADSLDAVRAQAVRLSLCNTHVSYHAVPYRLPLPLGPRSGTLGFLFWNQGSSASIRTLSVKRPKCTTSNSLQSNITHTLSTSYIEAQSSNLFRMFFIGWRKSRSEIPYEDSLAACWDAVASDADEVQVRHPHKHVCSLTL